MLGGRVKTFCASGQGAYHSAARDLRDIVQILRRRRYLLVLDESHYVKRPQGGVLAEAILELAPHAERRVILTGTPMPNGLADLWTQFTFLWHRQLPLGTANAYLDDIRREAKETSVARVGRKLAPLFFRTTKSQLGLPRPTFKLHKCPMSPLQARIYRGVAAHFLSEVAEAPCDRSALREWRRARAVRLLQVASNPALLRRSCDEFQLPPVDPSGVPLGDVMTHYARYETPAKITIACELVRNICASGRKAIVWSTFVHNLTMIAKRLSDLSPVVLHGGIPLATKGQLLFPLDTHLSWMSPF